MEKKSVFVREATGLVRELSSFDTFNLNLYNSAIGVTIAVIPPIFASLFPTAEPSWVILLGALFAWSSGWVYIVLSVVMPRSGADYVYNSRLISPVVGFAESWSMSITLILLSGLFASWIANFGLATGFLNYGFTTGDQGALALGETMATPLWTFVISTIAIIILGIIMLGGTRTSSVFMKIAFIPAMFGLIVSFFILASSSHEQFIQIFNEFAKPYTNQADSYSYLLDAAREAGFQKLAIDPVATIYGGIFSSIILYIGYQFSAYMGGEIKKISKAQPIGVMVCLFITFVMLLASVALYYNVVGQEFTNALVYLQANNPDAYKLPVGVSYIFFVGLIAKNPMAVAILSLSFVTWFLMLVFVIMIENSRIIFAWSFDRVVPEWLASVNARGAPWATIIATSAAAIFFLFIYTFVLNITFMLNTTLLYSITFIITGVSAVLLPRRRKDIFEQAPAIVNKRIAGVPIISIAGAINIIIYVAMFILAHIFPAVTGPIGATTYSIIIGTYVAGIIIFYAFKAYRRNQGIDLGLLFKEIPPE